MHRCTRWAERNTEWVQSVFSADERVHAKLRDGWIDTQGDRATAGSADLQVRSLSSHVGPGAHLDSDRVGPCMHAHGCTWAYESCATRQTLTDPSSAQLDKRPDPLPPGRTHHATQLMSATLCASLIAAIGLRLTGGASAVPLEGTGAASVLAGLAACDTCQTIILPSPPALASSPRPPSSADRPPDVHESVKHDLECAAVCQTSANCESGLWPLCPVSPALPDPTQRAPQAIRVISRKPTCGATP